MFCEELTVSPGSPTANGGPIQGGMNRRDFSPEWEGTEEPILTLKQIFHSSPQLDVPSHSIPSLCSFFADAL